MKKSFNQFETIHIQPKKEGWYNTDKGKLYWSSLWFSWSCRDDKISDEYPRYWYSEIKTIPSFPALEILNKHTA